MGCDIHPVVQVNTFGDWWDCVAVPISDRNYQFFGTLAGVRRDEFTPICEPRGFPPDIARACDERVSALVDGDHTASWFTLAEAKAYVLSSSGGWPEHLMKCWEKWIACMEWAKSYREIDSDELVRVVFNFDN